MAANVPDPVEYPGMSAYPKHIASLSRALSHSPAEPVRVPGSFGIGPWSVFAMALIALAFLTAYTDGSILTLEICFPIWALVLALRGNDNLAAPVLGFPIIFLVWMWAGSVTLLPASNLATTLLDPVPAVQWLLYLLGFVGYMGAVLLMGRPHQAPETMLGYRPRWDQRRFFLVLGLAAAVTFLAWFVITLQEGIPLFSANVEEIRVSMPTRHHISYQIEIAGANFLLPLIFAFKWSMKPRKLIRVALWSIALFYFFVLISQGNRGTVLPPLLTILIMRHFLLKPWRLSSLLPASLAALVATGASGYYRSLQFYGGSYATTQTQLGVPPFLQPFIGIYFSIRTPLTTFRDVRNLIPAIVPYQYGGLTFGVFSQLLPGRHPSSDYFFKDVLGHDFTGFGEPASLLGTFYADLGIPGIFIGMAGVGVMASLLYGAMLRHRRLHWLLIYSYILQKLISGIYGSLFEYILELLLPLSWFFILKYFAQATVSPNFTSAVSQYSPALSVEHLHSMRVPRRSSG